MAGMMTLIACSGCMIGMSHMNSEGLMSNLISSQSVARVHLLVGERPQTILNLLDNRGLVYWILSREIALS